MNSSTAGAWMPVALSADLPAGTVIPARVPDGAIALWRSQSGHLAASAERCPHRGMSLSHGFVRGEVLSCIYHGWSYARAGNCLRIPAHPGLTPPETIRVAVHDVEEENGIIWVAAGEPVSGPPRLDGLVPLRSLVAEADTSAIEAAAGSQTNGEGLIELVAGEQTVFLLVSVLQEGRTLIHALVKGAVEPATGIAASRALETLRRTAEGVHNRRLAP